jgi:hypothetical protein
MRLRERGWTAGADQDPFDVYADWRADEEISESRRDLARWIAAATVTLTLIGAYGLLQALVAG